MPATTAAADPQALAPATKPTTQTAQVAAAGRKHRIGGKLKAALDAMVWDGLPFDEAARTNNFHVRAMRKALERLHVRNYIKEQRDVFRTSLSAKNFHRLGELRDQDDNAMAALGAIKVLEQIEAQPASTANERPGLVIVVLPAGAHVEQPLNQPAHTIELQANESKSIPFAGEREASEADE